MTSQFHEGQEVYVAYQNGNLRQSAEAWRKAKIAEIWTIDHCMREYTVKFPDGTSGVFDETQIRAARSDLQDSYDDCHQCGRVP